MTYTGPLSQPILSAIKALAASKRIPATVTMTYEPGAVPLVIDVHWHEADRGFTIEESDRLAAMTDDELAKQVWKDVTRMLHPPKVERFKKKRRR